MISGNENKKCNLSFATNVLLTAQQEIRDKDKWQENEPRIAAILQTKGNFKFLHPFIPMVAETLDVKEITLVNSRACINVIIHEFLQQLVGEVSVDALQDLA